MSAAASGDQLLHSAIGSHDLFFAQIISMIPRDLYKPEEEDESENLNKRYHKHRKLPLSSDERKVISKKKIKEKYEPKEEIDEAPPLNDFSLPSEDLGLEGLKQRLQERIHSLRATRGDGSKLPRKSAESGKSKPKQEKKSANKHHSTPQLASAVDTPASASSIRDDLLKSNDDPDLDGDVEYSKFVESTSASNEPGKPGSKTKRLQRMLDEADRKRQRIEELKGQGKEGKERVRAEQWSEVIQEASGQKVLINTSKIKKALKRREKSKEKSAVEWQERISDLESAKVKKQEKREENIQKRKLGSTLVDPATPTTPKEGKKIAVIGKPPGEKKEGGKAAGSQQRPGFEGRKREFLNKKK